MTKRNVLITSAGRRGVLVRLFQREARSLCPGSRVFAADLCPERSSACQLADGCFRVPRVTDRDYFSKLIDLCETHQIGLIVPTIDTELLPLALHRDLLRQHGVEAVVSDADFVRVCRDKRLTQGFFESRGVAAPRILDPRVDPQFPMFAKPHDGSCSTNVHLIRTRDELTPSLLTDPKLIFQEYLSPERHHEYTLDMYYDRAGDLKCIVPRLRLETRGGEVSKSQTAWLPAMEGLRDRLMHVPGARGCLTLQVFVQRETSQVFGIEINPRFGGGFPLSGEAGANYPRWLIQEYLFGETVEFFDGWERDLTMLRYDDHVLVRGAAA